MTPTADVQLSTHKLSHRASDDYRLVQQAVAGDQKAYEILWTRYRHSVFHAMYKMVNNRDDAEDLAIEAMGKAFNKLASYAPNYAFSTWLFRIAINNCIDYIRRKKLQTLSMDEPFEPGSGYDLSHTIADSDLGPEHAMIYEQKLALVRRLVGQLSEKYRLMIELRYFEELSYEEIAQELNLPLGTVKAQLFRAKEILHGMLQQPAAAAFIDVKKRKAA
ncbi:MAG: polymerase sigma-24 factor [Bacteroidota bacterium]|jgi:RNA polymerase sigma-70 factor (ECF subfamily)